MEIVGGGQHPRGHVPAAADRRPRRRRHLDPQRQRLLRARHPPRPARPAHVPHPRARRGHRPTKSPSTSRPTATLSYDGADDAGRRASDARRRAARRPSTPRRRTAPSSSCCPTSRSRTRRASSPSRSASARRSSARRQARQLGDLGLLAAEARGFEWEIEGLRLVGRAQFELKAHEGARATWEAVRGPRPVGPRSQHVLGTIYQRLGDLTRSTQAVERALSRGGIEKYHRAELCSLIGRNAKTQWTDGLERRGRAGAARGGSALALPRRVVRGLRRRLRRRTSTTTTPA